MTTGPFLTPASGGNSDFHLADLIGRLIVLEKIRVEHVQTAFGEADATRANIYAIDDPVEEYPDRYIFAKRLQGELARSTGGMVYGRLVQGQPRPGQSAPWQLQTPSPEDTAIANAWLERRRQAQFTPPAQQQQYDRPPF